MKKSLIVAALAAMMVFGFASQAFAIWGGYASETSPTSSVGRETAEYLLWNDSRVDKGSGATSQTPHAGYETNTTKCAVCHSVHYAAVKEGSASGASSADATEQATWNAELLLRTTAGNACSYCHISTALGVKEVYAGDVDIFGTSINFDSSYAHDYHFDSAGEGCNICHTVHGASTYGATLTAKILRQKPLNRSANASALAGLGYATAADGYADTGTLGKDAQVTAFCATCHYVYATDSYAYNKNRKATNPYFKNHPMKSADTTLVAQGASAGIGRVAWTDSSTCRSCHDAGGVDQLDPLTVVGTGANTGYSTSNFPHYTQGDYRFLAQTSDAEHATDQSCTKCHINPGNPAQGVGQTY